MIPSNNRQKRGPNLIFNEKYTIRKRKKCNGDNKKATDNDTYFTGKRIKFIYSAMLSSTQSALLEVITLI